MIPFEMHQILCLVDQNVSQIFVLPALLNRSRSGDEGTRTPGLRLAKAALSQLSYIPVSGGSGPDWIRTSDPCVISTVL